MVVSQYRSKNILQQNAMLVSTVTKYFCIPENMGAAAKYAYLNNTYWLIRMFPNGRVKKVITLLSLDSFAVIIFQTNHFIASILSSLGKVGRFRLPPPTTH